MAATGSQNTAIGAPISIWDKVVHQILYYLRYLDHGIRVTLWYFLVYLAAFTVFITIYILKKLLSIKFGSRIAPDGRKCIIITGATSGIGLLLAKHFYILGFTVFAGYFNDQEPGYAELLDLSIEPFSEISPKHQSDFQQTPFLFLIKMDVRSEDSIKASSDEIDSILDKHNLEIYALINNAGTSREGPFEWLSRESVKDVITTNLLGVMLVTRQFLKRIILNKGRVVNVSSGLIFPARSVSAYGATKIAIAHFSESLHEDIKDYGALCCCVKPGNFVTTSNIIYPRVRSLQDSVNALSEQERSLYAKSIERHSRGVYRLLEIKLDSVDEDHERLAALHKIQIPDFSNTYNLTKRKRASLLYRFLRTVLLLIDGGGNAKSLADSGVINAFVDAVCLKSPPSKLYAGDQFYSHITGPVQNLIPPFLMGTIGEIIIKIVQMED